MDLGSGPGRYLEVFLEAFPEARGSWVDSSKPMLKEARMRLGPFDDRVTYILADASRPTELEIPGDLSVILTSRMVHHFSPSEVRSLYDWAFHALSPGGWFFNLDHVGTPARWEARYRAVKAQFTGKGGKADKKTSSHRHEHPYSMIDQHLSWLSETGFEVPDTPWRLFFSALISARRAG